MMKKLFCIFVFFIVTPLFAAPSLDLNAMTKDGEVFKLNKYKGKVVYIDFWASWCGPCRKAFPWMNQMQKDFAEKGLVVIAINLDSDSKDAQKFLAQNPANFDIAYDPNGKLAKEFGLIGMPSSYIFDRDGLLSQTHTGFYTEKTDQYKSNILALLKE